MIPILDITIVTYNRLEKLKHALKCYEKQTNAFRNLIIVDNCSTDGTHEFLTDYCSLNHKQFNPILITSKENLGGSGGFYLGEKKAMEQNADWVMVADDDAYAAPDMVEQFYKYVKTHDVNKTAAVCAAVYNSDMSINTYHRRVISIHKHSLFNSHGVNNKEYTKDMFNIDLTSYVGSFLNIKALNKVGMVNPNFFIYHDDTEHSLRLKKYGTLVTVPLIQIIHDDENNTNTAGKSIAHWKLYYLKRNHMHMLIKHFPQCVIKDYVFQLRCTIGAWLHHPQMNIYEKIERDAMWDAFWHRMGKSKKYHP